MSQIRKPNRFSQIMGSTRPSFFTRTDVHRGRTFLAYRFGDTTNKLIVLREQYDAAFKAEIAMMECVGAARTVLLELDAIILKQKSG